MRLSDALEKSDCKQHSDYNYLELSIFITFVIPYPNCFVLYVVKNSFSLMKMNNVLSFVITFLNKHDIITFVFISIKCSALHTKGGKSDITTCVCNSLPKSKANKETYLIISHNCSLNPCRKYQVLHQVYLNSTMSPETLNHKS
ncbi:d1.1 [Tranosema rostrale ichnovirus]|nr:d1.1 [Tranosema rostrale ichnovirus]